MGWSTGLEPATTSATNWRSTNWTTVTIIINCIIFNKMERETRVELATFSLEGWRSTNWATPAYLSMVGVAGFEPATPCSQGRCATELRYTPLFSSGAQTRNRTTDTGIFSPLLYRLSYLGIMAEVTRLELATSCVTGKHSNQLSYTSKNGGHNWARTNDPLLVRQVLSQLSYATVFLRLN